MQRPAKPFTPVRFRLQPPIISMKIFFTSFFFFIKTIFFSKKIDLIFSYHKLFARSDGRPPELIEPIISFCKKNNYSYLIFEESDLSIYKEYKLSENIIPLFFISLLESALRKLFLLLGFVDIKNRHFFEGIDRGELDQKVSKISSFFVRRIKCKKIITLVCHKSNFWSYGIPSAEIYDLQHGIIFDGDINSVLDGRPPDFKIKTGINTLVYSELFKDLLIQNDSTNFYNHNNVKKIGTHKSKNNKNINLAENHSVLFSAQNALDYGPTEQKQYIDKVTKFFKEIEPTISKFNLQITHRDHPRANTSIEIPYLDFSYVSRSSKRSLIDDLQSSVLHITFNSTSAIDAASLGVPTIFLELDNPVSPELPDLASKDIFLRQFQYPHSICFVSSHSELEIAIEEILKNLNTFSDEVLKWHDSLIEPITEDSISSALSLPGD